MIAKFFFVMVYLVRMFFCFFFFSETLKKSFRLKFTFSWFDFWFLLKFSSFPLLKGSQTPLTNSENVKVTKT